MDKRIWAPASPPPAPRSSHLRSSPSASSPFRQLQGNSRSSPGKGRLVPGSSGTMVAVKRRPDAGPSPRRPPSRAQGAENTPRPERVEHDRELAEHEVAEVEEDGEGEGMGEASMVVSHSQPDGMQNASGFRPMDVVEIHDSESEEETAAGEDSDEAISADEESEDDADDDDGREEDAVAPVHIEVRLRPQSTIMFDTIKRTVGQYIHQDLSYMQTNEEVPGWEDIAILSQHVDSVRCAESEKDAPMVAVARSRLHIHVYQTHAHDVLTTFTAGTQSDEATGDADGGGAEDQGDVAASVLELPAVGLEGVWDSLVYEGDVKSNLLNYIYSTIRFSEHDVDHALISWHRLVLLHGPPGTGKTSLCRGLAQKLAIRLSAVYDHAKLVEINSHSLFSKWFSESGKLVQRLFQQVTEMVEDESTFVVVLIDEVESLTSARAGAMTGNEPSDALRVVNALLTQLDKLKQRKNVLILTTSNLSAAIDPAFVDRADIKQYIGLPPVQAVYWVLRSCLLELMNANLIRQRTLLDYREALAFCPSDPPPKLSQDDVGPETKSARRERMAREASSKLFSLATKCHDQGMSGRALRRLPLLADARCGPARWSGKPVGVATFLDAMRSAIEVQKAALDKMGENSC